MPRVMTLPRQLLRLCLQQHSAVPIVPMLTSVCVQGATSMPYSLALPSFTTPLATDASMPSSPQGPPT